MEGPKFSKLNITYKPTPQMIAAGIRLHLYYRAGNDVDYIDPEMRFDYRTRLLGLVCRPEHYEFQPNETLTIVVNHDHDHGRPDPRLNAFCDIKFFLLGQDQAASHLDAGDYCISAVTYGYFGPTGASGDITRGLLDGMVSYSSTHLDIDGRPERLRATHLNAGSEIAIRVPYLFNYRFNPAPDFGVLIKRNEDYAQEDSSEEMELVWVSSDYHITIGCG